MVQNLVLLLLEDAAKFSNFLFLFRYVFLGLKCTPIPRHLAFITRIPWLPVKKKCQGYEMYEYYVCVPYYYSDYYDILWEWIFCLERAHTGTSTVNAKDI